MMGTSCQVLGAEAITQRFPGKGVRQEAPTRGEDATAGRGRAYEQRNNNVVLGFKEG